MPVPSPNPDTAQIMNPSIRSLALSSLSALALAAGGTASAQTAAPAQPTFSVGAKFQQTTGEAIYHALCQACHMPNGEGAKGAGTYPALAGNSRLTAPDYPLYVVMHGQKGMPPFSKMLSDAQVAEVVGYVRTHFGNHYTEPVTEAAAGKLRQ